MDADTKAKNAYLTGRRRGKRVPSLEPLILKSAEWASRYAIHVVKGQWPEAERVIAKEASPSYEYSRGAIRKPFPAGERAMAGWASFSFLYAVNILNGKFTAGERAIAESPHYSLMYADFVVGGRWRRGEKAIATSTELMLQYARQVLQSQLPRPMHNKMVMMTIEGDRFAKQYCSTKEFMMPTPKKRTASARPSRKKAKSKKP